MQRLLLTRNIVHMPACTCPDKSFEMHSERDMSCTRTHKKMVQRSLNQEVAGFQPQ